MATVAKSDRKKLVSTQVDGAKLIWHRVDSGAEIGRLDVTTLTKEMKLALMQYGAKQIVADVVSAAEGEAKFNGMAAGIAALGAGTWPRRPSAPSTMEPAIAALMANLGCDRAKAREMLGLDVE